MHVETLQTQVTDMASRQGLRVDRLNREDTVTLKEHVDALYTLLDQFLVRAESKWPFADDPVQSLGVRKGLAMQLAHIILVALHLTDRLGVEAAEAIHYQLNHLEQGSPPLLPGSTSKTGRETTT